MIKVTLKNRKYKIPETFTIDQWKAIVKMDMEDPRNWPKIMGIGLNLPIGKFIRVEEDSLILGASLIINQMSQRVKAPHVDFTTLTFGQFVDLDVWMVMGIENHVDEIVEMIGVKKSYSINEVLYIIDQYANFRISTYRSYSGLFGLNSKGEQEETDETWTPNKVARGWYRVIVDLADNDLYKLDYVTEQPLKKVLNFMALRKERALEEQFKQLEQKRKHDLQRRSK